MSRISVLSRLPCHLSGASGVTSPRWHVSALLSQLAQRSLDTEVARQSTTREKPGDMTHLAAGQSFGLAIKMRDDPRFGQGNRPEGHAFRADQVLHNRVGMPRRR